MSCRQAVITIWPNRDSDDGWSVRIAFQYERASVVARSDAELDEGPRPSDLRPSQYRARGDQ